MEKTYLDKQKYSETETSVIRQMEIDWDMVYALFEDIKSLWEINKFFLRMVGIYIHIFDKKKEIMRYVRQIQEKSLKLFYQIKTLKFEKAKPKIYLSGVGRMFQYYGAFDLNIVS